MRRIIFVFIFLIIIRGINSVSAYSPISSLYADSIEGNCAPSKIVSIDIEGSKSMHLTTACTNQDILNEYGYASYDIDNPTELIWHGKSIALYKVKRERDLKFTKIPFNIETQYVKALPHKKVKVTQKGEDGITGKVLEHIQYQDGRKKTILIEEWIEKEPKNKIVQIGSKYEMKEKVINGDTVYYWRTLKVLATSYDRNCLGCSDTTATGAKLTKGIIAVDPNVIPLHTRMYVPGYGFGKAEDVGGAVKGNKIDLGFYDLSNGDWSRRWVTIYIID